MRGGGLATEDGMVVRRPSGSREVEGGSVDSGVEEVAAESVVVMEGFGGDGGGNGGRKLRVCEDGGLHLRTAKKKEEEKEMECAWNLRICRQGV